MGGHGASVPDSEVVLDDVARHGVEHRLHGRFRLSLRIQKEKGGDGQVVVFGRGNGQNIVFVCQGHGAEGQIVPQRHEWGWRGCNGTLYGRIIRTKAQVLPEDLAEKALQVLVVRRIAQNGVPFISFQLFPQSFIIVVNLEKQIMIDDHIRADDGDEIAVAELQKLFLRQIDADDAVNIWV